MGDWRRVRGRGVERNFKMFSCYQCFKNEKLRIFRAELLLISQLMLLQTQLLGVTKQKNLTDLVSCSNGNK